MKVENGKTHLDHLRPFTQVAFECPDAERRMEALRVLGAERWVYDLVTGQHIVYGGRTVRSRGPLAFQVKLAFNTDLVEPKIDPEQHPQPVELEWISTVTGGTCNVHGVDGALAHLGYRVPDLRAEVTRMQRNGFKLTQISQTTHHTGGHRDLYRYAFFYCVPLRTYIKVIQKLEGFKDDAESAVRTAAKLFW